MDKVKIALALLKKYHFWVMLGLVILISTTGWFLAKRQLWAEYETNRQQIKMKFDDLNRINAEEQKNDEWIKGIEQETDRLKVKVSQAWRKAYLHQKTKVLRWPKNLVNAKVLENTDPTKEFPIQARDEYFNYIRGEFPRLLKIVDAENYHDQKEGAKKSPADAAPEHRDYKVIWDAKSQQKVNEELIWHSAPNSAQVREAQENLWVYEALLNIVANLNEFASGNYNAKVKRIDALLIGKDAATEFQKGMAETGHDIAMPDLAAAPAAEPTGAVAGGLANEADASARYVDENGKPLPTLTPGAEFKRMPVVMKLLVDQQELANLLVQCANSPLPLEVRQFRVHTLEKPKKVAGQGAKARREGGGDAGPYDVEVEIQGIISIFNPPDRTKLGDLATIAPADAEPPAAAKPADAPQPAGAQSGAVQPGAVQPPAVDEKAAAQPQAEPAAPEPAAPAAAENMPKEEAEAK